MGGNLGPDGRVLAAAPLAPAGDRELSGARLLRLFGRPLLLLLGLGAAGYVLRSAGLAQGIEAAGRNGPAAFIALGAALCAVGVPRQIVSYAGGLAFGVWWGAGFALLAEVIGAAGCYGWAAIIGRRWAARRIARAGPGRIMRLRARLIRRPFAATLTLRLLPVGNSLLLSVLAGVTGVRLTPFLAASAIGFIPQTLVFALLGQGVQVAQGLQIGLAIVLFAVSIGFGVLLLRREPDADDITESGSASG